MTTHISAILFDLDGTLIDSIDLIVACFSHTWQTHLGTEPEREWVLSTIGRPMVEVLEEVVPGRSAALLSTYRAYQDVHHDRLLRPFPEMLAAVRTLHAAGLPLGVVTSKHRRGVQRALDLFALTSLFQAIVSLDDTTRHKPDPEPLLEGSRRLGLPTDRVLYVGDSIYDVLAAQAAGMPVAAVLWGAGTADALRTLGPNLLAASSQQLLAWVQDRLALETNLAPVAPLALETNLAPVAPSPYDGYLSEQGCGDAIPEETPLFPPSPQ